MSHHKPHDWDDDSALRHIRLRALLRWLLLSVSAVLLVAVTVTARADEVPGRGLSVIDALAAKGWSPAGQGSLRWFGISIYRAALWAPPEDGWLQRGEFALVLRYQRDIPSQRLVSTSLDEMRRLGGVDEIRLRGWQSLLEAAFPDVVAGDVIVGLVQPQEGVRFFHGNVLRAQVDDPLFADAFFGIWLDERTREPGLRARLIGSSRDG